MKTCTIFLVAGALVGIIVGSDAMAQGSSPGKPAFFAVLLGGNEVASDGTANAGDLNGAGSATVIIRGTTLCYGLTVNKIDLPTVAHIHRGPAGVVGPIVLALTPPASGDPGALSACVPDVDADLLTEIRTNPGGFYVNVHTGSFPSGALRGQLF